MKGIQTRLSPAILKAALLLAASALVAASFGARKLVQNYSGKTHPVRGFWQDVRQLPNPLGNWHGEDQALPKETFDNTGAKAALPRVYRNDQDQSISVLLAIYDDPDTAVYHSPLNCYRSAGWAKLEESRTDIVMPGDKKLHVSLTTWEKKGERALVLFWYSFGNYTLFERYDLGKARWEMRGQKTWPPAIKVLLQTSAGDGAQARARILEMAKLIQEWITATQTDSQP